MHYIKVDDNLTRLSAEELEHAIMGLPEWRRNVCLRYKHEAGRRQSYFAYMLLCEALHEHYAIDQPPTFLVDEEHGKPSLQEFPHIHFNISHCHEAVACVVGDEPVGIDIETIRPLRDGVVRYSMNDAEQRFIYSSSNPPLEFTRLWTQKEAVVKLTGEGISSDIKHILTKGNSQIETTVHPNFVVSVATNRQEIIK